MIYDKTWYLFIFKGGWVECGVTFLGFLKINTRILSRLKTALKS